MKNNMNSAVVYCEGLFGEMDGKVANGLVRHSEKYEIVGVIDSRLAGKDTGMVLDQKANGILIYASLEDALKSTKKKVDFFIFGMAPLSGRLSKKDKQVMLQSMEQGLSIINGLHEFLTDDPIFLESAKKNEVTLVDIRKSKKASELQVFTGNIFDVQCPKIAVLGTDGAVGKRTTAVLLTKALKAIGLKAIMIATGQTGIIQGAKYGIAIDAIPAQFISGEVEKAVCKAWQEEQPDVLIIEGQGALSHPAYLSSCYILRGSRPEAVIIQHPPKREMLGDFPKIKMPTLESEIQLIETFEKSQVIGITLNHEGMTESEMDSTIQSYQEKYKLPTTDVLFQGCDPLVDKILTSFPELEKKTKNQEKIA